MDWFNIFLSSISIFARRKGLPITTFHRGGVGYNSIEYFVKKLMFLKLSEASKAKKQLCRNRIVSNTHIGRNPTREQVIQAHVVASSKKRKRSFSITMGEIVLVPALSTRTEVQNWMNEKMKELSQENLKELCNSVLRRRASRESSKR